MGFGLVNVFTEHLQIVTTSNYSAVATSHALQFTTACTESSQSSNDFQRHRYFSYCVHVLLAGDYLTTHSALLSNGLQWGLLTSQTSTRGDCLTTASNFDWSVCFQTLSRLTGLCFHSPDIASA
jgi:hypothetical protein